MPNPLEAPVTIATPRPCAIAAFFRAPRRPGKPSSAGLVRPMPGGWADAPPDNLRERTGQGLRSANLHVPTHPKLPAVPGGAAAVRRRYLDAVDRCSPAGVGADRERRGPGH